MKILIVKLGAMGDVLRTTPLLTALNKKFPAPVITWLVDSKCQEALQGNSLIHRLVSYSPKNLQELKKDHFDWAINLDKDAEALDAFGDYALRLGVDDDLKFKKNKKTYQEISFEQAGLAFKKEDYLFSLDETDISAAREHLQKIGFKKKDGPIVGLNTGSGARFAGKKLPVSTLVELTRRFYTELGATVFLLGGEDEIDRNRQIEKMSACPVLNTGSHPIKRFAAIVRECDLVVSGDTTAMHIAIAMKVQV